MRCCDLHPTNCHQGRACPHRPDPLHGVPQWAVNAVLALLMAVILGGAGLWLDGPTDAHAERATAATLEDAQRAERTKAQAEERAQERGPNAGYRWTAGGELVCTDKRGRT